MNASEAGGDLALIQNLNLNLNFSAFLIYMHLDSIRTAWFTQQKHFLIYMHLVSIRTAWFTQQKQWGLYQNKVTFSLAAIQRPGH